MRLKELVTNQKIIIQINLDEQKVELYADVLEVMDDGIYASPYIHNDEILELNIETHRGITCNIFADDHNRTSEFFIHQSSNL